MASTKPSGLLSKSRLTTLFGSILVTISCGTNYVYSAYAPQLGVRLHLSHTQLNVLGSAANVGFNLSGPFWGKVIDMRGPRMPLISASVCLLIGYSGMKGIFDTGTPVDTSLSTFINIILITCNFMTGIGSFAGLLAAFNTTAKSFPDSARATTIGLVTCGSGLSAFVFSTIANTVFPGDTSALLLILAVGTSLSMLIGVFMVQQVPLPSIGRASDLEDGANEHGYHPVPDVDPSPVYSGDNNSQTHLLRHERAPQPTNNVELSGHSSIPKRRDRSRGSAHGSVRDLISSDNFPNIYGKMLWISTDFWLIFTFMSTLSGIGLMYINNVGSISRALYTYDNPSYDEVEASRWQATQVSMISIASFLGRMVIGVICDFAKRGYGLPRSYCLSLVSTIFILSQIVAINVADVTDLWKASVLLGLAYGSLWGLMPTVVIDWFGIAHLSENWGYLSLSPLIGGNIFSIAFGRNLDAHTPHNIPNMLTADIAPDPKCTDGRECYVDSLSITVAATLFALGLGVWIGWRERQRPDLKSRTHVVRETDV